MQVVKMVFVIAGALALVLALCAVAVWVEKKFPGKEFDERQKMAKGRGYRLSFWVGILYYVGIMLMLLRQVDGEKTVEPYLLVLIGVFFQTMVDHTYCLLTHSALPLSQNRLWAIFGYVVCGLLQLSQFRIWAHRDGFSLVGHGTAACFCLIAGCCLFYLALLHIIQLVLERKE